MPPKTEPAKKMGRPPIERATIQTTVIGRLVAGESLRTICKDDDLPHVSTIMDWLVEDDGFSVRYTRAREAQADEYAAETIRIADEPVTNELELAHKKERIQARHWYAGKLKGQYSDKVESPQVQVNIQQTADQYFEGME